MIEFIIPGYVQAQERPRFSRVGKGVRTIDAPKSRAVVEMVVRKFYDMQPRAEVKVIQL